MKIRFAFCFVLFGSFLTLVSFRLVQLQILPNAGLNALAQRQFQAVKKKIPYRSPVVDRNGEELAVSIPASSVFARPKLIKARKQTARILAKYLGGTPAKWLSKLKTSKGFVWIQRQVSDETANALAKHHLAGIFVESENRRIYPNGELAANVLGFTDVDGNGISGMELQLNQELLAAAPKVSYFRDGKGNPSYFENKSQPQNESEAVYLTLDRRLQHALEEELDAAMSENKARGVMGIVMDPRTGEIFAMGQRPSFDPNRFNQFPSETHTNHIVSRLYEPGSTMKSLFAAAALEENLLQTQTLIDCEGGKLFFGKKSIGEAEADHRHHLISLEKVIQYSSNVGAAKVAQKLGVEKVRHWIDVFGLTSRTGISLPGEAVSGPKGDDFWVPIFLATVGFGQGVSVNPLQMVTAYAAFANGGYAVKPKILLRDLADLNTAKPKRILSTETVREMKQILVGVTEAKGGTGASAAIDGLHVAGKTGTAQKYESGVGYEGKKYFSSFIGFLPADNPELLVGVFVDEPQNNYYASQVATPLFKKIAERALHILDRAPKKMLAQSTKRELQAAPTPLVPIKTVTMESDQEGIWTMPDLKGMSMREAIQLLGKHLDQVKVSGTGYLETQEPKPGESVQTETPIVLGFSAGG